MSNDLISGTCGNDAVFGGHGSDTVFGCNMLKVRGLPLPGRASRALGAAATGGFVIRHDDVLTCGPGKARPLGNPPGTCKTGTGKMPAISMSRCVGGYCVGAFEKRNVPAICFVRGTRIKTDRGEIAVEHLAAGDKVLTLDDGYRALRWIGSARCRAQGCLAPVRIRAGALENERDLRVSQQHRMLLRDWHASHLFGEAEVLVPARALVDDRSIRIEAGGVVEYFLFLLDRHEIVFAEGAPSESFHPAVQGMRALGAAARNEITALYPNLGFEGAGRLERTARMALNEHEGRALARAMQSVSRAPADWPGITSG